jgi:ubiquinone/menaquinone biosynthesis C-methylase UbiE
MVSYPDKSFDLVICSHVLEHLENHEAIVADFYRVLKPQGSAFIFIPIHEESFYDKGSKHIWKYTCDSFRQMAERCRFRVVYTLEHQFFDMPFKALVPFGRRHPLFDLMRRVVQYTMGFIIICLGARRIDHLLKMLQCRATCLFVVLRKEPG